MPIVHLTIPIYLPQWLYHPMRRIKRAILKQSKVTINLWGDHDVEWSFVAAHMPDGPGEALDFGSGASYMSLIAARKGFRVIALDLEPQTLPWCHPEVAFVQGDLLKMDWEPERFDLVINCSTIEHVGLVGRYSVTEDRPDGDLEAMARLKVLMKTGGVMLLTVPVGRDATFAPLCRVYGEQRLPKLLDGYKVIHSEFWIKDSTNRWLPCDQATALAFEAYCYSWDPFRNCYALGCFVLRKP